MFNLSSKNLSFAPDGLSEPVFHYIPGRAGDVSIAMEMADKDGKFNSTQYSFALAACCVKDIEGLSVDDVPVVWSELDASKRIGVLEQIPMRWFHLLVRKIERETEIDKEEERSN